MSQQFFNEFECLGANGSRYRLSFEKLERPVDQYNRYHRLRIEKSPDGGQSWHVFPLTLGVTSRLRLWFSSQPEWPPEIVVGFGVENDMPWFEYEDDTSEPGWFGWPSRWRAQFDGNRGRWSVTRLQVLTASSKSG